MGLTVTALVVTYRQARYVAGCIRSVLAQTLAPDQVVVVDDGSDDDTLDVVRGVGDSRVELIALPHRGLTALAETYNRGLARARSDLVSTIEGDDRWRPRKLELHARALEDPSVVLAHGAYAVIGARGTVLRSNVVPPFPLGEGTYDPLPPNLLMSYVMPVTATMRRRTLEDIGGFHQLGDRPHVDHPTYVRLAERGIFYYAAAVVADWRKHGLSGTTQMVATEIDQGAALEHDLVRFVRARSARSDLPSLEVIRRTWEDAHGRQIWNAARLLVRTGRYAAALEVLDRTAGHRYSAALRAKLLIARAAARAHVDLDAIARLGRGASPYDELE